VNFRLRVFVLVALVAVTATVATAWLVQRQASQQITESAAADREVVTLITEELTRYGRQHGTWEGVPDLVMTLFAKTGQRIRLETDLGEVVVDSDHLSGQTARATGSPPTLVDARPELVLPGDLGKHTAITAAEIDEYRRGVRLAACLTRTGAPVQMTNGPYGVPRYKPERKDDLTGICRAQAITADLERRTDEESLQACAATDADCLTQVFRQRTSDVAPVPIELYLGAIDEPAVLRPAPALLAAGIVALLAIASTALLSRRVLRPIGALTAASRRLGEGDLTERVPVAGRDELAQLALSFNRMADSLQRGEERQRRLVADVAHELRSPLANLRGYLEALKDGVMQPDPELFALLHEEAVLQQRIVDDLQDLALAEAGALAYHRARVDVTELLETCRTTHQAVADAAGLTLSVSATSPVYVDADSDRLRQVLGNLVTNAIRANGSVTLSVSAQAGTAVIRVGDTGTGIATEDLPYVFDRFWRADAARQRATGGSGLGLAIARQVVTDHSGTITVASVLGEGTTFTITLPLTA
jgi:two-component system sensor histidine kinase BaeS